MYLQIWIIPLLSSHFAGMLRPCNLVGCNRLHFLVYLNCNIIHIRNNLSDFAGLFPFTVCAMYPAESRVNAVKLIIFPLHVVASFVEFSVWNSPNVYKWVKEVYLNIIMYTEITWKSTNTSIWNLKMVLHRLRSVPSIWHCFSQAICLPNM